MPLVHMGEWLNKLVNKWQFLPCIYEWVIEWVTYWVNKFILHQRWQWVNDQMSEWMNETFCLQNMNEYVNEWLAVFSVLADASLLKSVLECSVLEVSRWKVEHLTDTKDDVMVGLTSEDEAEGLPTTLGIARHWFGGPARVPEPLEPRPTDDEVVVKKRALKWVKQQMSALLHGEDLPKGAQAREVAEVLYQIPAVTRDRKNCPVCQKSFKPHHYLMVHMGVHRGEKFPCSKCGKVLATRRMWTETQRLVCQVTGLHALTVVRSMQVLKGCISTTRPSMVLTLLPRSREGSYVLSVVKGTKLKRPG